jgi:hypothetical protein
MVSTVVFLLVRRLLAVVGLGNRSDEKDVEIAVLRHQLAVLRRQVARPRYTPSDRMLLATLAQLLSRQLVRRRWTYPQQRHGRRLEDATVQLVLQLARENPRWGPGRSRARVRPSAAVPRHLRTAGRALRGW